MANPDSGGGPRESWADLRVLELSAALAVTTGAARPRLAARLAAILVAAARDDEAETLLLAERRAAAQAKDPNGIAMIELALAAAAVVRDDDAGALACLAAARAAAPTSTRELAGRALLIEARRARLAGVPAVSLPATLTADGDAHTRGDLADLEAEMAIERAVQERERGANIEASRAITVALSAARLASPRHLKAAELEAATIAAQGGDVDLARQSCRAVIDDLRVAGLRRDLGRAMLRMAELPAPGSGGEPGDTAASWLGRAEQVLGVDATWRDRLSIRTGLRTFGRRALDRVMTDGTILGIEAFERARGSLLNALAYANQAAARSFTDVEMSVRAGDADRGALQVDEARLASRAHAHVAKESVAELDRSMLDLVEIVGAALFERNRLRMLLNVLAEIDTTGSEASLSPVVASLATPLLDADRVVIALDRGGVLTLVGEAGTALSGTEDDWRSLAYEPGKTPSGRPEAALAPRAAQVSSGPRLAIPVRGPEASGLLYADRLRRGGQFREQDEAIAHLLAEYLAIAFGRHHARERERFLRQKLAATLDAIRDGVVACDADGVIIALNAAAARMLLLSQGDQTGVRLAAIPQLEALWALLQSGPRLDGAVVRLAHASFVVTARAISGDEDRGFVATLVELDRAQKIAQRLSATRTRYGFHDLIGTSPAITAAVTLARRAAATDANVLIQGESGTGKEVLAQAIHTAGSRAAEPFIGVNCAAVPRDLLEAELFGYEKGAFTGARADGNIGKFELAAGGTILLDEIGDMPLDMQAKLLRVLQERVVTRLGGRHEVQVHARVIATTHRDLAELVEEKKFRMDLLYRLRVLALELPSLRERREDIPALARHYLARFAEQQRKRMRDVSAEVERELVKYDWPGNVRELANVMEAEVSLAPADVDVLGSLATRLAGRFRGVNAPPSSATPSIAPDGPILPLSEVEKRCVLAAIERCGGSVSRASEALGISKVTIYAKLRAWGMHPRDRPSSRGDGPKSGRPSSPSLPLLDDEDPISSASPPTSKRSPGSA